jgi:hypothetical protein
MQHIIGYRVAMNIFNLMAALLLFTMACSSTPKTTDGSEAKEKDEKKAPLYYDFEDVLVPRDLKLKAKSSFVYHTSGITAGVLIFTSKVERNSLIQFFENNMAKDNWQAVSSFKSPFRKKADGALSTLLIIIGIPWWRSGLRPLAGNPVRDF